MLAWTYIKCIIKLTITKLKHLKTQIIEQNSLSFFFFVILFISLLKKKSHVEYNSLITCQTLEKKEDMC